MIKVLVADDQELIRQSLQIVLNSKEGIEVCDVATDGQEVIQCVRRQKPDVILMDIRMPVMTGYEAATAIRALDRPDADLPIIAMTADAFAEDIKKCLDHGMNAHVAKPIDVREVARLLEKYMNLHEHPDMPS